MSISPQNLRRLLILCQCFIFFVFELLIPTDLKFFSAYGVQDTFIYYPIFILPLLLLLSSFLENKLQPYFFLLSTLVLLKNIPVVFFVLFFSILFFVLTPLLKNEKKLTVFGVLLIFIITLLTGLETYRLPNMKWFWVMLHISWALKMIAWFVSVRMYNLNYSFNQFLNYFFNPSFYFLTNDLNVLTPRKFFEREVSEHQFTVDDFMRNLKLSLLGLCLLFLYGLCQKYYFLNLDQMNQLASIWVGGFLSIFVAILFHAANSTVQVSLLNAYRYNLDVDMNRPWMSSSPADYWRRMHFYVRDYIFEIIAKPILTELERWKPGFQYSRYIMICILYFLFTCTQIGYQPYRQERSFLVGFLVTGVFVVMMAIPEFLMSTHQQKLILKSKIWGRLLTFLILYFGYTFIFYVRRGF